MASSTGSARMRAGREISETISTKLYEMKWCWLALIVNSVLLWLFTQLETGMRIGVAPYDVQHFGAVVVEIILLIANVSCLVIYITSCSLI
jgi:hypothetical protein